MVSSSWGDAVNAASRMETTGEPGKIEVSASIGERLEEFESEGSGGMDMKGKGSMSFSTSAASAHMPSRSFRRRRMLATSTSNDFAIARGPSLTWPR
jgi:class 3 adenylate cyclase